MAKANTSQKKTVSLIKSVFWLLRAVCAAVGLLVLLAVAVEYGARTYISAHPDRFPPVVAQETGRTCAGDSLPAGLPGGDGGTPRMQWEPYVYWRSGPVKSAEVNIGESGTRHTWNADVAGQDTAKRSVRIFTFGGSAMWGAGVRDDETIASALAKRLTEQGYQVEVTNFAQAGYVSTQGLIALLFELRRGNVPDIALFYDGAHDACSAVRNGRAGAPMDAHVRERGCRLLTPANYNELAQLCLGATVRRSGTYRVAATVMGEDIAKLEAGLGLSPAPQPQAGSGGRLARDLLEEYVGNMNLVESLGRAYGFHVLFYWQPVRLVSGGRQSGGDDAPRAANGCDEAVRSFAQEVYGKMKSLKLQDANLNFHSLGDMFDREEPHMFVDCWNLTAAGNDAVARRISADVGQIIDRMQGS